MDQNKRFEGINIIYHTVKHAGGMERYVLDLINGFSAKGMKVRVITRKLDNSLVFNRNVEVIQIKDLSPISKLNKLLFDYRSTNKTITSWPTISCTRTPTTVDIAIVGGTHIGHNLAIKKNKLSIFDKLTNKREQTFFENAKVIVAHSKLVGQEVSNHYDINDNKLKVIYPPIDFENFSLEAKNQRERIRKELGINEKQVLLVFPSNNHHRKGLDIILEALNQSDPRFILAIASKKPVDHPKVINLGFRKDMDSLYAASDAAILASLYEPFGLVGPESILCGTPVILSDAVGATEVIESNACLKFKLNALSLAETLDRFLTLHDNKEIILNDPSKLMPKVKNVSKHCDDLIEVINK